MEDIIEIYEIISCILLSISILSKLNIKKENIIIYDIKKQKRIYNFEIIIY